MSVPPQFRTLEPVTTVAEYVAVISREASEARDAGLKADAIFRGQRCEAWPLNASASREKWKGEPEEVEQLLFREFVRTSPRLQYIAMNDDWDRLAVAQHHGLPTRLLDWTYSALSALYFVINRGPEKGFNGAVWRLQTVVTDFQIDFATTTPFSITRSRIYRPRFVADRIQAQAGLFVAQAMIEQNGIREFIPLEINSVFTERLAKIPVREDKFASLRTELHECGVNEYTVYPDLDGLTKHLTWRYSHGKKP